MLGGNDAMLDEKRVRSLKCLAGMYFGTSLISSWRSGKIQTDKPGRLLENLKCKSTKDLSQIHISKTA